MTPPMRRQRGQALIIALAFMFLAVPLVTGALTLAATITLDSRTKTRVLQRQYSALGAQQIARRLLITAPGNTTTAITLNEKTITTTITKLPKPPTAFPFTSSQGRLTPSKSVTPTSTAPSTGVTYTISILNSKDLTMEPTSIVDSLPPGFQYASGTAAMKDSAGATISTANPAISTTIDEQELTWSVPGGTSLGSGKVLTLTFNATTSPFAGVYCNRVYPVPGGRGFSSGPAAKVTVGSPASQQCKGAVVSVSKGVDPPVNFGNTTTTYTYTMEILNDGSDVVRVLALTDIMSEGLSYVANSVSSTPASFVPGEPKVVVAAPTIQHLQWSFGIGGLALPTSTTWTLEFKASGSLARGFYPNRVDISFGRLQLPPQHSSQFDNFDASSNTISDGESVTGSVGSDGAVTVGQNATINGDVSSLESSVVLGQGVTVAGNIRSAGAMDLGEGVAVEGDMVSGGDFKLGEAGAATASSSAEGSVWAGGSVQLVERSSVAGNVVAGGTFQLGEQASVGGYVWSSGIAQLGESSTVTSTVMSETSITLDKAANVGGGLISAGDCTLGERAVVVGDVFCDGNVDLGVDARIEGDVVSGGIITLGAGASITGDQFQNATVPPVPSTPPVPPVHGLTTDQIAIETVIDVYRVSVFDGLQVIECEVWVASDIDVGTFVQGCAGSTQGASVTSTPP